MTTRTSSVEVAIRIRPLRAELNEVASKWDVRKNSLTEIGSENDFTFTFDRVYDPSTSTEDVYASSVKDSIVRNVVQGFNGTVFAYGQTGSGKSHTMLGDKAGNGISGMALRDLFEGLKKEQQQGKVVKVYLEMIEIYNEQLRDLMVKKDGPLATLSIRENEHGVYVHNAIRQEVSSAQNCLDCMEAEAKNRVVAATKMNEQSSRSHCLIRIIVEKTQSFDDSGSDDDDPNMTPVSRRKLEKKIVSSLNLVDLAGSERVSKTGATGVRMVEGGHINKSLACLTTVINKLSEPAKKGQSVHIPFRDSKLTYLLKTALGGNSYTTVFCCITPAAQHADESRSTLFFAQRAKAIKNEIQLNEVVDNRTKIRELELLVKKYKAMLVATDLYLWAKELMLRKAREESTDSASAAATAAANEHVSRLESLVEQLTHENETLKEEAQHNVFLGVAGGGAGSSGAGGHTDPMYGLLGFADGEQVARLKSELAEMERTLTEALQDKSTLIESVADLEEICEGLGRENEEKDARLNDLKVKLRDVEHENMLLRNELDAKLQQLEQAQAQKQQQQQALMERARGDGLLEQLTQLQVAHQTLELEHSTLIELYSKAEIESAAALKVIEEERDELAAKIASSRNETIETNAFLWRLVSLGHLAAQGTPIERDEIKIQQPVKPARVDQALKSLELFVASRSNRPPALSELGATPQRSAVSTDAAGQPPAQGPSGGDEALLARIKELESQMQLNEARRDIVIDTKLKRMQELVLRLHTTNSHVMQDLHTLCRENDALHALIRRESKLAKIAEKEGLLPANEALLKNRALNTRLPEPPFFHN